MNLIQLLKVIMRNYLVLIEFVTNKMHWMLSWKIKPHIIEAMTEQGWIKKMLSNCVIFMEKFFGNGWQNTCITEKY